MRLLPTCLTSPKVVQTKRAIAVIAAGLTLVTLAACGDDGEDTDEAPGTTEEASDHEPSSDDATTTTELTLEGEVLAAFEEAMKAVVAAYDPPDPNHPDLLATHAGQALFNHQNFLTNYEMEGVSVVATTSERDPEVTRLVEDTATVEVCLFEILTYVDSETREEMREPEEVNELIEWSMERRDGVWKIVSGTTKDEETC